METFSPLSSINRWTLKKLTFHVFFFLLFWTVFLLKNISLPLSVGCWVWDWSDANGNELDRRYLKKAIKKSWRNSSALRHRRVWKKEEISSNWIPKVKLNQRWINSAIKWLCLQLLSQQFPVKIFPIIFKIVPDSAIKVQFHRWKLFVIRCLTDLTLHNR